MISLLGKRSLSFPLCVPPSFEAFFSEEMQASYNPFFEFAHLSGCMYSLSQVLAYFPCFADSLSAAGQFSTRKILAGIGQTTYAVLQTQEHEK